MTALALLPHLLVGLALSFSVSTVFAGPPPPDTLSQARLLLQGKDYLGFRVLVKKAYPMRLRASEWYGLRTHINGVSEQAGIDLIYLWNARNPSMKSDWDLSLEKADASMLKGRFNEALTQYQAVAKRISKYQQARRSKTGPQDLRSQEYRSLYLNVLHSMARALYGAGRFEESLKVYQWIGSGYPRFRQVLFEKMWAAFKAGKMEIALGAIASQRSAYFSRFLSPEAYLIQIYIYKRLCRQDDLREVIKEMKLYEANLKKGELDTWAQGDINRMGLWRMTQESTASKEISVPLVTPQDRIAERASIIGILTRGFQSRKDQILAALKKIMAYGYLAEVADTTSSLKPIQKLTSRAELLEQDLEVWPADSQEDWLDEMGRHVLIGESLCNTPQ